GLWLACSHLHGRSGQLCRGGRVRHCDCSARHQEQGGRAGTALRSSLVARVYAASQGLALPSGETGLPRGTCAVSARGAFRVPRRAPTGRKTQIFPDGPVFMGPACPEIGLDKGHCGPIEGHRSPCEGHSFAGVPRSPWGCALFLSSWEKQEGRCSPMAVANLKVSDDELDRLRDKYPAWHIWMSQARRLWATRKGQIAPGRNRDSRWSMAIDADTSEDLERQLEEQILLG